MGRLLLGLCLLLSGLALAQSRYLELQSALPLATVGDELGGRWEPSGDAFSFDLKKPAQLRVWIFSPGLDRGRVGDERFTAAAVETEFQLYDATRQKVLVQNRSPDRTGDWLLLSEGDFAAGQYVLQSFVYGAAKNTFLPVVERLGGERLHLRSLQPTINVKGQDWVFGLRFELPADESCDLRLYDGDGSAELELRLLDPHSNLLPIPVPENRNWVQFQLPPLAGSYGVELRQPAGARQASNALRFMAVCAEQPLALDLILPELPLPTLGATAPDPARPLPVPQPRLEPPGPVQAEPLPLPRPLPSVAPIRPLPRPLPELQALPLQTLPLQTLPTPELSVDLAAPQPALLLSRSLSAQALLPCDSLQVSLTLSNPGSREASYELREVLPDGVRLLGEQAQGRELIWRGRLAAGESLSHSYELLPLGSDQNLELVAELSNVGQAPQMNRAQVALVKAGAELRRIGEGPVYVGDRVSTRLTLSNPLARDLRFDLTTAQARLRPLDLPETVTVLAGSSLELDLNFTAEQAGLAVIQISPQACGAAQVAGSDVAILRETVLPLPELPSVRLRTTLTVDMAAYDLPRIDGLVLVQRLPEGVSYIAGTTLLNGQRAADPAQAGDALVFDIPDHLATLQFAVLHEGPYAVSKADSSLLALTPEPELLLGDEAALELYSAAVPLNTNVTVKERVGAVILSPEPGTVLKENSSAIRVDTPLGHEVTLYVNDALVAEDRLGKKTLSPDTGRQTFEYIGVPLVEGPNALRVESRGEGGASFEDRLTLFVAGLPERVSFQPLSELVADSATPLRFELRVTDAWGNRPANSFVTLEIEGAQPALPDASSDQVGYQLAFDKGQAVIELEPLEQPGKVTFKAFVGRELGEASFQVLSNLRPWIVSGYGSVGALYSSAEDLSFGVGGSFFARGRLFDAYLLTLAANYPLEPLGIQGNPFETFPVPGTSGFYQQDALSRQAVYARLERNLSYLQYGDFDTALEGELLALGRRYTGLSARLLSGSSFDAYGYAAYAPVSERVTDLEIAANDSRVYILSNKRLKPGSVTLEVIKRDTSDARVLIPDDSDRYVGELKPLVDYVVDEVSATVQLAFVLPERDTEGNPYYLRASFSYADERDATRALQFGAQLGYSFEHLRLSAGVYQESGEDEAFTRLLATRGDATLGALQAQAELAYGQNKETGGLSAVLRLAYQRERLGAEARYQYIAEGYRSAVVADDASAGHSLGFSAHLTLSPELSLSADAAYSYYQDSEAVEARASLLGSYASQHDLGRFGRDPSAQFGVDYQYSLHSSGGLRLIAGLGLREPLGVSGAELSLLHRQSLSAKLPSSTDFSVSYQLLENLTLRLTDRLEWGNRNNLIISLESGFENSRIVSELCRALLCEQRDPTVNLGTTMVSAQYELAGGLSGAAGHLRLGLNTSYPLSDALTLSGGLAQTLDLEDGNGNATALNLAALYDTENLDASFSYDIRFAADIRHALGAGTTFALSDELYGSLRVDYLNDASQDPRQGLRFSLAGAYRGDDVSLLTQNSARFGRYAEEGRNSLSGDTRLSLPLNERWSVRAGYIYAFTEAIGFRDMLSLGATAQLWQGGSVTGSGRLFHDWSAGLYSLGATLEASQELGCGVYGVAGYNLFDGVGRSHGAHLAEPGLFLRLDIVFDEEWRCGAAELAGHIFVDLDGNGVQAEDEAGLSGVLLELYKADGERVRTAFSGEDGGYHFKRLAPASYLIRLRLPYGYEPGPYLQNGRPDGDLLPRAAETPELRLGFGSSLTGIDLGLIPKEAR